MKQEPKEIPNPDMPDDDKKDVGDVNEWLNNFEDDAAPTVAASTSAPKRRKTTKVLVCVICKRSSEDWG